MNKKNIKRLVIAIVLVFGISIFAIVLNNSHNSDNINKENNGDAQNQTTEHKSADIYTDESGNFIYNLKETYTSRNEIKQERRNLQTAYYTFTAGKNDSEILNKATEYYEKSDKILNEWLRQYPADEAEILFIKEYILEHAVSLQKDSVEHYERYRDDYSAEEAEEKIQFAKETYEFAHSVETAYKNGEISIDEAFETLGLVYEEHKYSDLYPPTDNQQTKQ